jgi:hypothetical protein
LVILVIAVLTLSFGVFFGMTKLGDVLMRHERKMAEHGDGDKSEEDSNEETKILRLQPLYGKPSK